MQVVKALPLSFRLQETVVLITYVWILKVLQSTLQLLIQVHDILLILRILGSLHCQHFLVLPLGSLSLQYDIVLHEVLLYVMPLFF